MGAEFVPMAAVVADDGVTELHPAPAAPDASVDIQGAGNAD